jgi:DNA topoisomerase-2
LCVGHRRARAEAAGLRSAKETVTPCAPRPATEHPLTPPHPSTHRQTPQGLGTSNAVEAKEYFARLDSHRKQFVWEGEDDGQAIEMAFSKKRVEDRKRWLSGYVPGTYLDQSVDEISYSDFVHKVGGAGLMCFRSVLLTNCACVCCIRYTPQTDPPPPIHPHQELILFSRADLERSIPCLVDGLKPGQRKILYCAFKRNLKKDIKVAQLAGYVSEHSAYHHGETSLQQTIIGLAQVGVSGGGGGWAMGGRE